MKKLIIHIKCVFARIIACIGVIVLGLMSLLPFCILYTISDSLYYIVYRVLAYRHNVVRENLRTSFPEKSQEGNSDNRTRFLSLVLRLPCRNNQNDKYKS